MTEHGSLYMCKFEIDEFEVEADNMQHAFEVAPERFTKRVKYAPMDVEDIIKVEDCHLTRY